MSESQKIYDPHILVEEVASLLRERGLTPTTDNPETMGQAVGGAGMLLRALGIRPGQEAIPALSRSVNQEPWEEHDSQ